ncbi:MAG: CoA transferase, partial [Phascolarctobacterium sp.]|nr:CoA transferase [Phascolarctobacterium sp.]
RFCDLIECPELEKRQYDFAHKEEIEAKISAKLIQKTQGEWLELIGGAEFCVTPVLNVKEALESELTANENMLFTEECDMGKIRYMGAPVKFSDSECIIRRRAPRHGEHGAEILAELGFTAEEVAQMQEAGKVKA